MVDVQVHDLYNVQGDIYIQDTVGGAPVTTWGFRDSGDLQESFQRIS